MKGGEVDEVEGRRMKACMNLEYFKLKSVARFFGLWGACECYEAKKI